MSANDEAGHMKSNSPLGHYRSVGAYSAAAAENRSELVLQLMDSACEQLVTARGHMQRQETAQKGEAIRRAGGIIDGLRASLDHERGGQIASNLDRLYDYMNRRLVEANLSNSAEILDEVGDLLGQIRDAWRLIAESAEPA